MNFWMDVALDNLKKVIGRVDKPVNDEEARQLTATLFASGRRGHSRHGPQDCCDQKENTGRSCSTRRGLFAPATPSTKWSTPPGRETLCGRIRGVSRGTCCSHRVNHVGRHEASGDRRSVMASFTCEAFGTEGLASLDVDTLRARHNAYLALTACGDVVWPQG